MEKRLTKIISAFLVSIMLLTMLASCGDINIENPNVGDVNVGGIGNNGTGGVTAEYTVTFTDWDGNVLKIQTGVKSGESAVAPKAPTREGYTFVGWDKPFNNVNGNITVTASYVKNETGVPSGCKHDLEHTSEKAATCDEGGNIEYWYCEKCDSYFDDSKAENEIRKTETVASKLGHTVVIDEAVAATYEKTGLTEGSHCSVCNEVLKEQKVTDKLQPGNYSIVYKETKSAVIDEKYNQYSENEGFDLPTITTEGYKFEGWYTKPEGGEKVTYIAKGEFKKYLENSSEIVFYAHWSPIQYTIYYEDAPLHSNPAKYTIESDEIKLSDPEWSGLKFTGWTDENGNPVDRIEKETTGTITLTANWKRLQNTATQNTSNDILAVTYNEEMDKYHFIYELGTIEHVVLDRIAINSSNLKYNTKAVDMSFTLSNTVSIEDSVAETIAKTVSNSVSQSKEWSESNEWVNKVSASMSWENSTSLGVGLEAGAPGLGTVKTEVSKTFTVGGSIGAEGEWGEVVTKGGSDDIGSEQSDSVSSATSYKKEISSSVTTNITISKDMPEGYYSYVHAGNIRVFAVVSYDPITKDYYLDTYSFLDNMHEMMLYYRDVNELNSNTCEELKFIVPYEKIESYINSSLYTVKFDANGGEGSMETYIFGTDLTHTLPENKFTKAGYIFTGWEMQSSGETKILQDMQQVKNLVGEGETAVLKAKWTPIVYSVKYDANTGKGEMDNTSHTYDVLATLPSNDFYKTGYSFVGWNTKGDGSGTSYAAGAQIKNLTTDAGNSVTLYAQWKINQYTITFNSNGGTAVPDMQYDYQAFTKAPDAPTRDCCTFVGWSFDATSGFSFGNPMPACNVVATAIWEYNTFSYDSGNRKYELDATYEYTKDTLDLSTLKAFLNENYILDFKVTVSLKEIDQGTQEIYLCKDDKTHIAGNGNYGGGRQDSWTDFEETWSVSGADCTETMLLRYGSHGNNEDDWYLGKTTVLVTVRDAE